MYPINNVSGIIQQEQDFDGMHIIVLFLIKPSDCDVEFFYQKINYFHYRADKYCSLYLLGCMEKKMDDYPDSQEIKAVDNKCWYYSDKCFIEAATSIEARLKHWSYSGAPEMIILQKKQKENKSDCLDFSNYVYIDIAYAIKKGYIDDFGKFMERFLQSCKKEVEVSAVMKLEEKKRLKCRKVLEHAIESAERIPAPIKEIMRDKLFFKTYKG